MNLTMFGLRRINGQNLRGRMELRDCKLGEVKYNKILISSWKYPEKLFSEPFFQLFYGSEVCNLSK